MNKIHKIATALMIIGAVGLTYASMLIKSIPESFEWEDEYSE
jgi:hypothetical protein